MNEFQGQWVKRPGGVRVPVLDETPKRKQSCRVCGTYALNHAGGLTDISVVRSLEYTGRETPPTVILADCYGTRLSVTVEILAQP